jgi:hypothetical protein
LEMGDKAPFSVLARIPELQSERKRQDWLDRGRVSTQPTRLRGRESGADRFSACDSDPLAYASELKSVKPVLLALIG